MEFIKKYQTMIVDTKDIIKSCIAVSREKREYRFDVDGAYIIVRIHEHPGATVWIQRNVIYAGELAVSILDTNNIDKSKAMVEFFEEPFDLMDVYRENKQTILEGIK